jgi:hypothetical protein
MSTAGVVSHPAAAVAPLARSARFSSIAVDPVFKGETGGTFHIMHNQFQFLTSGFVNGQIAGALVFGNGTTFNGSVDVGQMTQAGHIKLTSGYVSLTSNGGANSLLFHVRVGVKGSKFTFGGRTVGGGGVFAGLQAGKIEGRGSFHRSTGTIDFELTVHVP